MIDAEGIYCIYNGISYGFIKEDGTALTAGFPYDLAYPFSEGLACVSKDGKYGYLDTNGKEIIPLVYDYTAPFMEGLAYFVTGDQYGFMNNEGEAVFYLDCDSVSSFQEGLAFYSVDGKYGYLDSTGETVVEPFYDDAGYFHDGLAKVTKNGWVGVVNTDGQEVVPAEYQHVKWNTYYIFAEKEKNQYDCFNRTGKKLIQLSDQTPQTEGEYLCFEQNGNNHIMDSNGTVQMEWNADWFDLIPEKKLVIAKRGEQYGVLDFDGKEQIPFLYQDIRYIKEADIFLAELENQWGGLDGTDFSLQIPFLYQNIRYTKKANLFLVKLENQWGGLNGTDFSLQIPFLYQNIQYMNGANLFLVKLEDQWGGLDGTDFSLQMPICYDEIDSFTGDQAIIPPSQTCADYQVVNRNGEVLFSAACDDLKSCGAYYKVTKMNRYGFLDRNGKEIVPVIWDRAETFPSQSNVFLMTRYSSDEVQIIKTKESDELDYLSLLLQNEITPKKKEYYQLILKRSLINKKMSFNPKELVEWEEWNYSRKEYKLYDIDHSGQPILYYYMEPYIKNFPSSVSGFYTDRDGKGEELLSGYECGGSARGDSVRVWRDIETGELLLGTAGTWGGFGGYVHRMEVYQNKNKTLELRYSFYEQHASETKYLINEEAVTQEEYEKAQQRYQEVSWIE